MKLILTFILSLSFVALSIGQQVNKDLLKFLEANPHFKNNVSNLYFERNGSSFNVYRKEYVYDSNMKIKDGTNPEGRVFYILTPILNVSTNRIFVKYIYHNSNGSQIAGGKAVILSGT